MHDSPSTTNATSRRGFLKQTGAIAATGALAGVTLPHVFAAEDNTMQVAVMGPGGRGTGATANALRVETAPMKLVAMADVAENRLKSAYEGLKGQFGEKVDVPEERKFIGFDGYKKAMDCLRPGKDIAILTTPPAFRWVMFKYAIERGLHVFMEKPVSVDGPSARRMFELSDQADAKGLKVGVGLMIRHCKTRQGLFNRIRDGEIGEIIALRGYRMHGPVASAFSTRKPEGENELLYQIRRFHSFIWASGGCFNDYYIHNIDECCWMKNDWPVEVQASGGRHFRGDNVDQNFDNYSCEYTFKDGTKMFFYGRCMAGCHDEFASFAHGSKSLAVISSNSHWPSGARIYKGHKMTNSEIAWRSPKEGPELDPYQVEWQDLVNAIRNNTPYNEVKRGVQASLVATMGRKAAHTGQVITYDEMWNDTHELAPDLDKLTLNSPAPVLADANGRYPVPQPGVNKTREY
jgi:predicted dehydrogenase